eukprot:2177873-Rhodomonas_salina.2
MARRLSGQRPPELPRSQCLALRSRSRLPGRARLPCRLPRQENLTPQARRGHLELPARKRVVAQKRVDVYVERSKGTYPKSVLCVGLRGMI